MYDVVIIGAGPAGLTAAIYASRASLKVLVLESQNYGGQIINTLNIENYPAERHITGYDFATKLYNQAKDLGAEVKYEKVISVEDGKVKKVKTNDSVYETRSIIIATGNENKKLGIKGEEELTGRGISYCATCDGGFYKDKEVAVVGGGSTALEDAIYLSNIAKKVYLIIRKDASRGERITLNKLENKDNVEFLYSTKVTKIIGEDKLKGIEITNKNGEINILNVEGLFIAIGRKPNNEMFANIIKLNDDGYVESDELCHTNKAGIFVAGDTRSKSLRQLVTATSDGAISATEALKYVSNNFDNMIK